MEHEPSNTEPRTWNFRTSNRRRARSQHVAQRPLSRKVAAHPVHANAWRSRSGADVPSADRRRIVPPCGPRRKLPEGPRAASDIAADVVRVVPLDVGRGHDVAGEHTFA